MRPLVPPIVLLGPPGAGKSTVLPLLAARLGFSFVDLDERAHAERFAEDGEPRFRVREHLALRAALEDGGPVVIAAGAGVVAIDENLPLLERALCLVLDVDDDTSLSRLAGDRPWLQGVKDPRATLAAREAGRAARRAGLAAATGGAVVDGRAPLNDVIDALCLAVDTARLPRADDPDVSDVLRAEPPHGGRRFVVADPRVVDVVEASGTDVDLALHLPPRDKRLGTVERLLGAFVGAGVGRSDTIVAVGGGVLLDVVGLAAALHHRGTPWRAVPTTLLAMVDAGLGGKTAVDIDADRPWDDDRDDAGDDGDGDGRRAPLRIRNAAGAFHAPASGCVWPGFLRTLDEDSLRQGRAEMVKHALLVGDDVMAAATAPLDAALLARSRGIKRGIVERDPQERHLRFALNLGHTVAHGLESRLGLTHGDAVLHGLRAALHVSEVTAGLDRGVADEARAAIARLAPPALPALDDDDLAALAAACRRDKKGGRVVLLRARGSAVLADIDDTVLLDAVRTLW